MPTYGQMLREARLRHRPRLTQKDVAVALKVKETTISRWENDINPPSRHRLQDVINLLGLQRDEFVKAIGVPTVPLTSGQVSENLIRLLARLGPDAQRDLEDFLRKTTRGGEGGQQ